MYNPPPNPRFPPGPRPHAAHVPADYRAAPGMPRGFAPAGRPMRAEGPTARGFPSALAFGLGIVAVVVALAFDVVFLKVHIPGVGGYAWYLSTALSFAAAGYFGFKWTRASQATSMVAVAISGALYGVASLGLGVVVEHLVMGSALFLGLQGLVIAVICGGAGVRKAVAERD